MPLLSLPLPRLPTGFVEYLPIRVPFPFMRIASILPHAINEPIKTSLLALFKLAWSAKVQLPVLITVCFMAFDIRLQLEINIFWENNNGRQAGQQGPGNNVRNTDGQRRTSREDMRRAALVAAALYQQQRRRLIQGIRAQQARERELGNRDPLSVEVPLNAPLATAEDSDLEDSNENESDSDTITCSQRSTTSDAGLFGSDEEETDDAEDDEGEPKKKKKTKRSRPSSKEPDEDTDDSSTDEDDDDGQNGGSGGNAGTSHGSGGGYRDDPYDHDSDDTEDNSHGHTGGGYSSPLVVEVEIRHRPIYPFDNENCQTVDVECAPCTYKLQSRISINKLLCYTPKVNENIFMWSPMNYLRKLI